MSTDRQTELDQMVQQANERLKALATMIPATPETFAQTGAWERNPYTVLRLIYETLREQQTAIETLATTAQQR